MSFKDLELYLELINGIVGLAIFVLTLMVFISIRKRPQLIKSYFFLKGGNLSRPFFYFMIGMLIWGVREFYKVLEIEGILHLELFYEITEFISAVLLLLGMMYFYRLTRSKKLPEFNEVH